MVGEGKREAGNGRAGSGGESRCTVHRTCSGKGGVDGGGWISTQAKVVSHELRLSLKVMAVATKSA